MQTPCTYMGQAGISPIFIYYLPGAGYRNGAGPGTKSPGPYDYTRMCVARECKEFH